ncbi:hypothetical protein M7784_01140 [Desulfovibrio aminophilus]|nr:hypothetical protein [Desulfovibrio aminophilus]MCM0753855.1 hypothetical protein [Desulfovibrio aminophilus]
MKVLLKFSGLFLALWLLALPVRAAGAGVELPVLGGTADRGPAEVAQGESFVLTVTNPEQLSLKGLSDAQAGDQVEVRRMGPTTWTLRNLSRKSALVLTGNTDLVESK